MRQIQRKNEMCSGNPHRPQDAITHPSFDPRVCERESNDENAPLHEETLELPLDY